MRFKIIVAVSKNGGIGKNGSLPWRFKTDMNFFANMTKGIVDAENNFQKNVVVMGRKTWESLPHNALEYRDNIILSSNAKQLDTIENQRHSKFVELYDNKQLHECYPYQNYFFKTIPQMIKHCGEKEYRDIWIIGGSTIYKEIYHNYFDYISDIYITHIHKHYECDSFFPIGKLELLSKFKYELMEIKEEKNCCLYFQHFHKS
jgi:dihydrofolate reductase